MTVVVKARLQPKMRNFIPTSFLSILMILVSCGSFFAINTSQDNLKFLEKAKPDTSKYNYGSSIELINWIEPSLSTEMKHSIDKHGGFREAFDDTEKFNTYSLKDKITILEELLSFQGDRTSSNKMYKYNDGRGTGREGTLKNFTVEVEALFTFTRLLLKDLSKIKPVLLDQETKSEILRPEEIKEIYSLYRKWLRENIKTNFHKISLPLTNSPYQWLGEEKLTSKMIKESL